MEHLGDEESGVLVPWDEPGFLKKGKKGVGVDRGAGVPAPRATR
jgi:hypothetical protein